MERKQQAIKPNSHKNIILRGTTLCHFILCVYNISCNAAFNHRMPVNETGKLPSSHYIEPNSHPLIENPSKIERLTEEGFHEKLDFLNDQVELNNKMSEEEMKKQLECGFQPIVELHSCIEEVITYTAHRKKSNDIWNKLNLFMEKWDKLLIEHFLPFLVKENKNWKTPIKTPEERQSFIRSIASPSLQTFLRIVLTQFTQKKCSSLLGVFYNKRKKLYNDLYQKTQDSNNEVDPRNNPLFREQLIESDKQFYKKPAFPLIENIENEENIESEITHLLEDVDRTIKDDVKSHPTRKLTEKEISLKIDQAMQKAEAEKDKIGDLHQNICGLCNNEKESDGVPRPISPCGHWFHKTCIEHAYGYQLKLNCPTCFAAISP